MELELGNKMQTRSNKCHIVLELDFLRDMLKQFEFCYDAIHQLSNTELVSGRLVCFEHSHCQNVRSQIYQERVRIPYTPITLRTFHFEEVAFHGFSPKILKFGVSMCPFPEKKHNHAL